MGATIYCLCNQKGGCAKTMTSVSLGIGLAREGRRVLMVDMDPQGSMTASLGWQQPDRMELTLSSVLGGILQDIPLPPGSGILRHEEGIDLLPANIELSGLEVTLVNAMSRETVLRRYLDTLRDSYDAIVLDCIFTIADMMETLGCAEQKANKLLSELDSAKGIGLIERKRRGLGKPNIIYVKNFTGRMPPESQIKNCENHKSGNVKITIQELRKSQTNDTDLNNTDFNDTDLSIHPSAPVPAPAGTAERLLGAGYGTDRSDKMDSYREIVKENIDFDILLQDYPYDGERLEGFVELMAEVCSSGRRTVRVNQEDMPTEVVKGRFLKLDSSHIRYVIDCLDKNTTLVGNIRAYTLSALFNAPVTISQYYASLVSHDIDLPVVGTSNNSYYLTHDFWKEKSSTGCPFMDKDTDQWDFNRTIYAHNMGQTSGAMFSPLLDYKDGDFFMAHRQLYYTECYGTTTEYQVMAVVKYNAKDIGSWDFRTRNHSDMESYNLWIEQLQECALYYAEPDHAPAGMLTLSTCDRSEFGKDGRLVIVAGKCQQ